MERVQASGEPESPAPPRPKPDGRPSRTAEDWARQHGPVPSSHMYSREANLPWEQQRTRTRRATRLKDDANNKNTCSLFIQTDPLIWRHIFEQVRRACFLPFLLRQSRAREVFFFNKFLRSQAFTYGYFIVLI